MPRAIKKKALSDRYVDERLGIHWKVDSTEESFSRLMYHLEIRTNFKPYFEEALKSLLKKCDFKDSIVVVDIGAGTGWTSAILAKEPNVSIVYAVDPSFNRLKHARFVIRHFRVEDKVKPINGTFCEPNVEEKADLVVLCGSLHHCYNDQIPLLFQNIKRLLKPDGKVLVANDHYVTWSWKIKRLFRLLTQFYKRSELFYSLNNLRAPDPFSGEHWRTRKELTDMFKNNGFKFQFFVYEGDLCKDKPSFFNRMGWRYYYAILTFDGRKC
jgi:SAM-dependent methyltransferase